MDIFTALQTAVTGLKAQSYAIDNISGNIANSQTTGYKRIDTSFVDLIAEQTPRHEVAGTVLAQSQLTNTIQGNITATSVPTNMALNGSGFFTVQTRTGDTNGQPTFSGTTVYTRRGDFTRDASGFLVNGAGSYLTGDNLDPVTGQVKSSGPIVVDGATLPARQTTSITYGANLPRTPTTATSQAGGSSLYTATGATTTDTTQTVSGLTVASTAASDFVDHSIVGPSLTAYTESGAPISVSTRWAKVQDYTSPTQPAVWNLYYAANSSVVGSSSAWTNTGTAFAFNAAGQLTSPAVSATTGVATATIPSLTVDGTNVGTIALNLGKGALTQYASASGSVTTNTLKQDGYAAGTLNSLSVSTDGKIMGTYSNGSTLAVANVGIARFTNPDGLKAESGGNYSQTNDSGAALVGLNGATVVGGNVEQSNTDIAGEFSKMIVTQQAYSANTRVMSTAQSMMSDLLNVIR
ncbi:MULTISPECIES: flagellar hook-basal body complex protein [Methylobacterium]|uniref:Flagellar hook protein FlgE n=2 Tax=Pseudomonadota TaxID=1224 RepID=A0ABQ4SX41_9HYPH|nr:MULTISPECIES: flagellar hook-basal body complex protein [Methylobacterium]PIU05363.1 MAG: flagellar biosynthesis protein FlgE [Methylobacterium sp. CG09_land_8_20_14_0_10_71_15]PIU12175.1 MAG: flagellar biosynthesis protein FlgE [Methylobacterium sp. CG08_land_8_20_14_0_20_71_15]GJE06246.1 Flagellar hook protein FlgE [Methylobacterium jeotgali]